MGMGEFNSHDRYIYYHGQESLRRNGVAIMVNKRFQNAVLGWNLKNDRMISVHFQMRLRESKGLVYHGGTGLLLAFSPGLLKYRQRSEGFICREVLLCILGWCLRGLVDKLLTNSVCLWWNVPSDNYRDQAWDFFGRNDAKAETPVLWLPHTKSWLIGKDSDAWRRNAPW